MSYFSPACFQRAKPSFKSFLLAWRFAHIEILYYYYPLPQGDSAAPLKPGWKCLCQSGANFSITHYPGLGFWSFFFSNHTQGDVQRTPAGEGFGDN